MLFIAYNFRFLIFENGWNKKIHELNKLEFKKGFILNPWLIILDY